MFSFCNVEFIVHARPWHKSVFEPRLWSFPHLSHLFFEAYLYRTSAIVLIHYEIKLIQMFLKRVAEFMTPFIVSCIPNQTPLVEAALLVEMGIKHFSPATKSIVCWTVSRVSLALNISHTEGCHMYRYNWESVVIWRWGLRTCWSTFHTCKIGCLWFRLRRVFDLFSAVMSLLLCQACGAITAITTNDWKVCSIS